MLYVLALKIVLSIVQHLILAIFVAFVELVYLSIVSAWHLQRYIVVSLSSDKALIVIRFG